MNLEAVFSCKFMTTDIARKYETVMDSVNVAFEVFFPTGLVVTLGTSLKNIVVFGIYVTFESIFVFSLIFANVT